MKIKVEVITAVNESQKYKDCIPLYIDYWLSANRYNSMFEYIPKVFFVNKKNSFEKIKIADKYRKFISKYETNLPTVFVSQNLRSLICFESVADYAITSDIDLFPLSTKIFDRIIVDLKKCDNGIAITRDVLAPGQYPICYTVAKPSAWKSLIDTQFKEIGIEQKLEKIYQKYVDDKSYDGTHGGEFWFVDQEFLYDSINSLDKGSKLVFRYKDYDTGHRRLDREDHRYPKNWFQLPLLLTNYFTDYHVHHPVSKNLKFITVVLVIQKIKKIVSKLNLKKMISFTVSTKKHKEIENLWQL